MPKLLAILLLILVNEVHAGAPQHRNAINPLMWADVPDPSVIRVDDTYYMSSTTMHMNPGIPIMKSKDLVNWELVNYAYDIIDNTDELNLENGKDAYGQGSWASSLRFHEGRYYVSTFCNNTKSTYIYSTDDIENGLWKRASINQLFHDASLFFDNGRAYLIYGNNDIFIIELTADATAIKAGSKSEILIPKASSIAGTEFWVPSEGSQVQKIYGRYYINLISWPANGIRTQLIYRSDSLKGKYEGRIVLADKGVAQGGLIDTPEGQWYAYLFQDHGAVGRIPYLVPVQWQDEWPIYGVDGKVPDSLDIKVEQQSLNNLVANDDFNYEEGSTLHLAWQWSHNPVNKAWSLDEHPGYLRLKNHRIDKNILKTQNSLTQRTFGPKSQASVKIDTQNMKLGDNAGLALLQANYAWVGVRLSEKGKQLVMGTGVGEEFTLSEAIPLTADSVHLRASADFQNKNDKAVFSYSIDGKQWHSIGSELSMQYTLPHFMGYRFALFNFATKETGGFVDFDYYRIQ